MLQLNQVCLRRGDRILFSNASLQVHAGQRLGVTGANGSGKFYVYDAVTREEKAVINMPGFGDPHGIPFVYYDEDEKGRLVVDQNGFHNDVNAQDGNPLSY